RATVMVRTMSFAGADPLTEPAGRRPTPASRAVARHSIRLMRADAASLLSLLVMPIVLMAFFKPMARQALQIAGYRHVNGAEQVVPGMTVGFGVFMLGYVAFGFMAEHTWGTWERVRASRATPFAIVLGKLVPAVCLSVVYEAVLF